MAKTQPVDSKLFKQVQEHSKHLLSTHTKRNALFDNMAKMYLLTWDEENSVKSIDSNLRITISPDPRNKLIGATRLLTASEPTFEMPAEMNSAKNMTVSDKIEKAAAMMWRGGSRLWGAALHYDMALSAFLWDEVHVGVSSTEDLVEQSKGSSKATERRATESANIAPYLYEVYDPRQGYPEFDKHGLRAYYRRWDVLSGELIDSYGDDALRALGDSNRYRKVICHQYYDLEWVHVWVDGGKTPIIQKQHNLPRIPVIVAIAEGSRLFPLPEERRQPFLYSTHKSGMWKRENLSLTVLYHLIFGLGVNPLMAYNRNEPGKELTIVRKGMVNIAYLDTNESLSSPGKNMVDPQIIEGLRIAEEKVAESTIYSQTLGEPLTGANVTFSLTSLLNQAGRLPLIRVQRAVSWAIADLVKLSLIWLKEDKRKYNVEGMDLNLEPKDIPDNFEIAANLEVSLPQDKFQQAMIASQVTQGDNPLMSMREARESLLNIGQSDEMDYEIWSERAAALRYKMFIEDQVNKLRAQSMPQPQEGAPGQANGQGMMNGQPGMDGQPGPPQGMMGPGGAQPENQQNIQRLLQSMPTEFIQALQAGNEQAIAQVQQWGLTPEQVLQAAQSGGPVAPNNQAR
jgi:hypothetical protein